MVWFGWLAEKEPIGWYFVSSDWCGSVDFLSKTKPKLTTNTPNCCGYNNFSFDSLMILNLYNKNDVKKIYVTFDEQILILIAQDLVAVEDIIVFLVVFICTTVLFKRAG